MNIRAIKVNSFTSEKEGGNPAGVVLKPSGLIPDQMKRISDLLQVSETAYVFPSKNADYHVRFFSPAVEVDLCGHATIATFTVLGNQMQSKPSSNSLRLTQQTKAGILPVQIQFKNTAEVDSVFMKQKNPIFEPVSFSFQTLAETLMIDTEELCSDLLPERVSTGLFTLPVCVSSFSVLKNMKPDFHRVKRFCRKHQVGSLHVFTFDTIESKSLYHARNFAPLYDINEDPVTGTANGAVCSYLRRHQMTRSTEIICEQGDIINKSGRVTVKFLNDSVWVGGKATVDESVDLTV
ncbi:MAG: PhzF family phenazine biosynthesis protein [Candidatus Thermoplasmatota archaeon]|nr:PhzF family phenazine biosynthesis protein [Candidatus Thermoplasmatota archaeon]